jgi:NAD-dependent SIR2 family protein deacetylase
MHTEAAVMTLRNDPLNNHETLITQAADALREAEALLILAGAGMGVDSGLPDFRGNEGFWRAYPPFQQAGLSFQEVANPAWFVRDPELAWGFYGHRLNLYRATEPHPGFALLRAWSEARPAGGFVFTSNVDGQFQKAGFPADAVVECHGSIHHLQCSLPCTPAVWSAEDVEIAVDEATFRARAPLPRCPACGRMARPNILMFHDGAWLTERAEAQDARLADWRAGLRDRRLVLIECGAGTDIATVRWTGEALLRSHNATLIRINPRNPEGPRGTLSLPMGARQALEAIADALHV